MIKFVFFSFRGRLGRLAYLGYGLLALLVSGVIMGIGGALAANNALLPSVILIGLGVVMMFWSSLAMSVKRLHDMDLSGHHLWWIYGISMLGGAVQQTSPALAILLGAANFGVGIWLLVKRGTNGDNRFGPSPVPIRDDRADYYVPPNQQA